MTIVDSSGSYTGRGGPVATAQRTVLKYRLLGAVGEGSRGNNIFYQVHGPFGTVAANRQEFEAPLDSFQVDK